MITIRNETEADYALVEEMTRRAFYNIYMPGCVEHYLVRVMRGHADFVPELDMVLERDGQIVGNVMYTKATLTDENGAVKPILTFGPVCIDPAYQRQGFGKMLLEESFARAKKLGYDTVVIFGSPANYVGLGFQSCKKHNICAENGTFPAAMLVKTLSDDATDGRKWIYRDSPVMAISEEEAAQYDDTLPPLPKKHLPSQEEFYILSQATLA